MSDIKDITGNELGEDYSEEVMFGKAYDGLGNTANGTQIEYIGVSKWHNTHVFAAFKNTETDGAIYRGEDDDPIVCARNKEDLLTTLLALGYDTHIYTHYASVNLLDLNMGGVVPTIQGCRGRMWVSTDNSFCKFLPPLTFRVDDMIPFIEDDVSSERFYDLKELADEYYSTERFYDEFKDRVVRLVDTVTSEDLGILNSITFIPKALLQNFGIFQKATMGLNSAPSVSGPHIYSTLVEKVNTVKPHELQDITMNVPEGISGYILDTAKFLEQALDDLFNKQSIETDIQFLIKWAGLIISDKEYINKVWEVPNTLTTNEAFLANTIKEFKLNFTASNVDELCYKKFYKVYNVPEDLDNVSDSLSKSNDIVVKEKIKKYLQDIDVLYGLITDVMAIKHSPNGTTFGHNQLSKAPKAKLNIIINFMYNLAKRIELMALLIFHLKTLSIAHSLNVEKIKKIL